MSDEGQADRDYWNEKEWIVWDDEEEDEDEEEEE